jgi:hypothetical protein
VYPVIIAIFIIVVLIGANRLKATSTKKKKLAAIREKWANPNMGGRNLRLAALYHNLFKAGRSTKRCYRYRP